MDDGDRAQRDKSRATEVHILLSFGGVVMATGEKKPPLNGRRCLGLG